MAESPFIEDAGPGFDPDAAAAGAEHVREQAAAEDRLEGEQAFGVPEVPEEKVRHALFVGGDGLHAAFGVGEYDWVMTQRDLDRIGPPLTRIINRYEMAKAVAGLSDELALAMGIGLWGWRSTLERVAVIRAEERAAPQPSAPPPVRPAPPPPPQQTTPPPAWPTDIPPAPQAGQPSPAPASAPTAAVGGDHFPGAGAPRDLPPVAPGQLEVADGYVTRAERIRQSRERKPVAIPAEAPSPAR